jgi:hypothetical protein
VEQETCQAVEFGVIFGGSAVPAPHIVYARVTEAVTELAGRFLGSPLPTLSFYLDPVPHGSRWIVYWVVLLCH